MTSPGKDEPLDALIIGAGFSGICMAKRLKEAGITNFRICDKAQKVGGTWYWNSYPGAACDVMSHFYSFSFAPNPDWSHKYSPWAEIQAYSERCVESMDLWPHIELRTEIEQCVFDDATRLWMVILSNGSRIWTRNVLDGTGGLHVPLIPHIEGGETFEGEQWHSSLWRHDVDLAGKKVAVIGSAASAVQFVPEIAKTAACVTVFQRSPNYLIPRNDRRFTAIEKWCFRHIPIYRKLYRLALFLRYDWLAYPIVRTGAENFASRHAMRQFRKMLNKHIGDPVLREQLTPDFPIGCKRILISDNFYPCLTRENVSLITQGIERITPSGIKSTDGVEHEADILVFATGFDTQGQHTEKRVTGPGGRTLGEAWADAPIAYEGNMVAGFPNYFFITGPNTGVGSTSVIFMIEQSANLIMNCLAAAGKDGLIEPADGAMRAYDKKIQAALAKTVWATSCSSWYKREDGRITILYPFNAQTYRKQHRKFHRDHFKITTR